MTIRVLIACILVVAVSATASAGIADNVFRVGVGEQQSVALTGGGRALSTDVNAVANIVHARAAEITLNVPMPDGTELPLTLQRMSVLDMTSRITFMTENGPEHHPMLPSLVSYRAALPDNGMAVFTLDASGTVSGMIDRSGERIVVSQRCDHADPSAHVVKRERLQPYACGTTAESMSADLKRIMDQTIRSVKEHGEHVQSQDTVEMKVAIEGDYQLFRAFASKQLAMNYITELMALVATIYERDLAVRMVISNVRLWETSNDPYPDSLGVFDGLREVFVSEYRTNMTSIDRDIAVMLTKRSSEGGIAATIGGICQEDGSYACADVDGSLVQNANGWTWDATMIAHEIGHVCGGLHTQSCFWPTGPLDSCVASEGGTCVSWDMTRPARGTIMSYCHNTPGSVNLSAFHPLSRNVIRAYIRSATCMNGVAPARTARLHGVVRDGNTGEPLAGVPLVLGRYIDQIVRQVPPVDGDTIATTGPDGSYSFTGLGYGIYNVSFGEGWVPAVIDDLPFSNSVCVSVADTVTRFDIRAVRGQRVEFVFKTTVKDVTIQMTLYSEQLPDGMTTVKSPWYILPVDDSTYRYVTFLPDGQYVAVPHAAKVLFTPNKITFMAEHTKPTNVISVSGASTGSSNKTAIAMGVVELMPENGVFKRRFLSGLQYVVRNVELDYEAGRGTVPDDGVIVVDSVLTPHQYAFTFPVDTAYQVAYSGTGTVNPYYQRHTWLFAIQNRRKPLIARAYRMQVQQRSYESLQNPTVLASTAMGSANAPIPMTMPFPLTIIDRELTSMQISPNGFISFGPGEAEGWLSHPFEFFQPSQFSIAVFTGDLYPGDVYPESNTSTPWSIAYDVTGTQPDRTMRVEWSNVRAFAIKHDRELVPVWVGPFTFQVHIHENGSFDMLYKQSERTEFEWPIQTRIGLRGNDMYDNMLVTAPRGLQKLNEAQARFTLSAENTVGIASPTQFTPGLAYHWEIDPVLSVEEDAAPGVSIHPTVATTSVELHGIRGDIFVRVVDLMGTVVRTVDLTGGARTIDTRGLASGCYTAVFLMDGTVHALPFVVAR